MSQVIPNIYALYWIRDRVPHVRMFNSDELTLCLCSAEDLRQDILNSHVSICSDNPNSVGKQGVSDPNKDYSKKHWKRRLDPNVPVGRNDLQR